MVRSWSRNSTGTRYASNSPVVQIWSVRPAAIAGVTGRHIRSDPAPRVGSGVGNRARKLLWVVSLSCCDALHSILETGVRWYAVGQGTLRAPDTPATHPSSRHDLSGPLPSLGSRGATYAAIQLHGSAPALVTVLASFCAVTRNGNTPTTTTVVFRTTSGPWRIRSCAVLSADYSDAVSSCPARQNWC